VRIDILTLFPELFDGFIDGDRMRAACVDGDVELRLIDFRTFSTNKHGKVDDAPYGGGAGMVLQVQPIRDALQSIAGYKRATKLIVTPQGQRFDAALAKELRRAEHLIVLCGHYEGFDERIRDLFDREVSIGDFVMTGGELAAMAIVDNIVRHALGSNEKEGHPDA